MRKPLGHGGEPLSAGTQIHGNAHLFERCSVLALHERTLRIADAFGSRRFRHYRQQFAKSTFCPNAYLDGIDFQRLVLRLASVSPHRFGLVVNLFHFIDIFGASDGSASRVITRQPGFHQRTLRLMTNRPSPNCSVFHRTCQSLTHGGAEARHERAGNAPRSGCISLFPRRLPGGQALGAAVLWGRQAGVAAA
jgi:hypothetical protein